MDEVTIHDLNYNHVVFFFIYCYFKSALYKTLKKFRLSIITFHCLRVSHIYMEYMTILRMLRSIFPIRKPYVLFLKF